jgi:hypothetical protein
VSFIFTEDDEASARVTRDIQVFLEELRKTGKIDNIQHKLLSRLLAERR